MAGAHLFVEARLDELKYVGQLLLILGSAASPNSDGIARVALESPSPPIPPGGWVVIDNGRSLRIPDVAKTLRPPWLPPDYFRIELSWAKFAGLAALLVPMVPARLKEWAYAGFAIKLVSALIAPAPNALVRSNELLMRSRLLVTNRRVMNLPHDLFDRPLATIADGT